MAKMDGTEDRKDTSEKAQDSSKGQKGTSKETPETLTKETQAKAVSDALATAGRTAKAFEKRETALQDGFQVLKDAEAKAEEKRKADEAKELEDATPGERTDIQRKQALRADEFALKQKVADHEKVVAEHQTEIDAAKATKFETARLEIATKHGVDVSQLKDLGITDLDQLEKVAKGWSTKKATGPDPGGTIGGGAGTLSAKEKVTRALEKMK